MCIKCNEEDEFCHCPEIDLEELWIFNIDMRKEIEWRSVDEIEYDEAMEEKNTYYLSDKELKQREKDEIETLIDLNLE